MSQPDKVVVKGLPPLDGEYPFNIETLMLSPGDPDFMTYREWHEFQQISKVTTGEAIAELDRGNTSANLALIVTVLRRARRQVDVDDLWDAPGTTELRVVIAQREAAQEDEAADPPSAPDESARTDSTSPDGGESSRLTLASPENDPSRTGALNTAISHRETSAV